MIERLKKIIKDITAISHFIEESKRTKDNGLDLKINDLVTKSSELTKLFEENYEKYKFIDSNLSDDVSKGYLAGSKESANRKGMKVVEILNHHNVDLSNYGFVSLGGGDGSELFTEIANSSSNFGILLEYDNASIKLFYENSQRFKLNNINRANEIEFHAIESDLLDKNKLNRIKELVQLQNLDGIVVSIHAVLHELFNRSKLIGDFQNSDGQFNLEKFFKLLYEWHDNIWLFVREPGKPENWNDEVNVRLDDEFIERFKKILKDIDELHFSGTNKGNFEYHESQKLFTCNPDLAIEALTKLFYYEDYEYERGEKVTSISREKLVKAIEINGSLFEILNIQDFHTNSVEVNFEKFNVKVTGSENTSLPTPNCFSFIYGRK